METVIAELVTDLRDAGEDRNRIAAAFGRFINGGLPVCGSPSALWDYPVTALRKAGFDANGKDRRFRIYSTVSHERFGDGRPLPLDWPWHEQ